MMRKDPSDPSSRSTCSPRTPVLAWPMQLFLESMCTRLCHCLTPQLLAPPPVPMTAGSVSVSCCGSQPGRFGGSCVPGVSAGAAPAASPGLLHPCSAAHALGGDGQRPEAGLLCARTLPAARPGPGDAWGEKGRTRRPAYLQSGCLLILLMVLSGVPGIWLIVGIFPRIENVLQTPIRRHSRP